MHNSHYDFFQDFSHILYILFLNNLESWKAFYPYCGILTT